MHLTREERLARTLVELADTLVDDFDVGELLGLLVERSVELFDATAAGLVLADIDGTLRLMASTSEAMKLVELFQVQSDQGPCLDCYRSGEPVIVEDLAAAAPRWPRFSPFAVDACFRSAHALPMRLRGRVIGALNLFRSDTGDLGQADVSAAQALADVATIAILQSRAVHEGHVLTDQLQYALHSRIAIEQAKGMLAERPGPPWTRRSRASGATPGPINAGLRWWPRRWWLEPSAPRRSVRGARSPGSGQGGQGPLTRE